MDDNEQLSKEGFDMGTKMACAVRGMDYRDVPALEAHVDTLLQDASIQKMICKAAALVLELGQQEGSLEHRLFCKMAAYDAPFSEETVEAYIAPVLYALAEKGQQLREDGMAKAAGIGFGTLGAILGSITGTQKLALLAALGVGGAGGTVGWLANRDATEDAVDVEALEAQAEHYRDIAADIQKKMNLKETPSVRHAAAGESNFML